MNKTKSAKVINSMVKNTAAKPHWVGVKFQLSLNDQST